MVFMIAGLQCDQEAAKIKAVAGSRLSRCRLLSSRGMARLAAGQRQELTENENGAHRVRAVARVQARDR
jgi:hypothetical protein